MSKRMEIGKRTVELEDIGELNGRRREWGVSWKRGWVQRYGDRLDPCMRDAGRTNLWKPTEQLASET